MSAPYPSGIHPALVAALAAAGVDPARVHLRYSDVQVMLADYGAAVALKNAGPWKSMADVFHTNPDHPDAALYPYGVEVPFGNLAGYLTNRIKEVRA